LCCPCDYWNESSEQFCCIVVHLFFGTEQLPDADKLFTTVKKPSFIDSNSSNDDIDWDKLSKSKVPFNSEVCKNTHTVPPPQSYEPQSAALKPTLGNPHEAIPSERKRHAKGTNTDSDGWYMKSYLVAHLFIKMDRMNNTNTAKKLQAW